MWAAFWTLSASRGDGPGGPRGIGFEAIDRYAVRYGIEGVDEFEELMTLIRAMDGAFIDHVNERGTK